MKRIIEQLWNDATVFGSMMFYLFLIAFVYLIGDARLSLMLFAGFILSFAVVGAIRLVYFRNRPNKEGYDNIIEKLVASSFPSMHSMRAALMLVLFLHYYMDVWISFLFAVIAIVICISRYKIKKHYVSDIIVGFILGVLAGYGIYFLA